MQPPTHNPPNHTAPTGTLPASPTGACTTPVVGPGDDNRALDGALLPARSLFHLAFHVTDLDRARQFYGGVLGCTEGRSTDTWVDFDFFSHQISLHLGQPFHTTRTGRVGDHWVPMPHFGLVLLLPQWRALADRLLAAGVDFVVPPHMRFAGQPGEQGTLFFCDPFGNPIEVKGFASREAMFAT